MGFMGLGVDTALALTDGVLDRVMTLHCTDDAAGQPHPVTSEYYGWEKWSFFFFSTTKNILAKTRREEGHRSETYCTLTKRLGR